MNSGNAYQNSNDFGGSDVNGWTEVRGNRGRNHNSASIKTSRSNVRDRLGPSIESSNEGSSSGRDYTNGRRNLHQRGDSGDQGGGRYRSKRGREQGAYNSTQNVSRQFVRFSKAGGNESVTADTDDAMDGGNGLRTRHNPYGRQPNISYTSPSGLPLRTSVSIDGISANIPVEELVAFITKKANPPVTVKTGQRTDGKIILEFENSKQASTVYRLHGIPFAGGKLYIRYYSKPMARNTTSENGAHSSTNQSIDLLRSLVTSRFHAESRRLDFDRIIEDPVVKKEKIKVFDQHNPQSKFGPVLCKIIQEVCPNLETLSLSGNKLCTLDHFSTLYQRVPSLVNLSLQDNMISSYRDLEPLHAKEFPNLREVVLIGNPLRERELSRPGGEINYTSYIKKLFPTINILDMQPVLEEIQFDVVKPLTKLPLDTKCGFMGSDSTRLISQQFLQMFYSLFDTNRAGLADFYGDNAVLSLSVDTARPLPGNRGAFQSSARQSDKALDSWAAFNRNLYKIKQPEKRVTLAYVGQTKIIHALGQIPGTLHPLGDPPERKKFLVEAINGVAPATYIHITVHGEFKDLTASALLSFDRTFIIVPAIPGSRSAMASLPFTITNDSWAIRRYSSNYAWSDTVDTTITASSLQPTHSTPISNPAPVLPAVSPWPQLPDEQTLLQYRIRDNLNEQQHTLVVEFAKATGLNYSYSLLCLQQTGWSAEAAGQAFLTAKNMIPPEAFKL